MLRAQVAIVAVLVASGCAPDHATPAAHEVAIVVDAPGLSAEGVEREIVEPLERALAGVAGVRTTRAIASPGAAVVACGFATASGARAARAEVVAQLAEVSLPDGASAGLAAPEAVGELAYVIRTDMLTRTELRALQDSVVRPQLAAIPGVVEVRTCGGAPAEVTVRADPARLAARGLDLEAVVSAITATSGSRAAVELLRDAPIAQQGGAAIHVGDVATVSVEAGPAGCEAVRAGGPSMIGFVELGDRGAIPAVVGRLREVGRELPHAVELEVLWQRPPLRLQLRLPAVSPDARAQIAGRLARQLGSLDATVITGELRDDALPDDLVVLVPRSTTDRAAISAVEAAARALPELGPVRGGAPELVIRATGPDLDVLDRLVAGLHTQLAADRAVAATDLIATGELPFLDVDLDRAALARFGVAPGTARDAIAARTTGLVAGSVDDASRRLAIRVLLDGAVDDARLAAADGSLIPLSAVTTVRASTTRAAIVHHDGRRTVSLWLRGADRTALTAAARRLIAATATPPGYTVTLE